VETLTHVRNICVNNFRISSKPAHLILFLLVLANNCFSDNSDVYLGWVGWAAGSFDQSYELTLTPTDEGDSWKDTSLMTECIAGAHA
jgi:hypothetical protein